MAEPRYALFAARAVFDDRLTATDLRVLAALGTHSNHQGWLRASQGKLAKRIGVARTTVTAAIGRLVETGYIETRQRYAETKGQISNIYRVRLDTPIDAVFDADLEADPPVSLDDTPCQKDTWGRQLERHPLSSQDDTIERSSEEDTSTPLRARNAKYDGELWKTRVLQAIELAGPSLLPTNPVHRMPTVFRFLCEPVIGEPCDWDQDVLPAIAAANARGAKFDKWDYIKPASLENRNRRLAGLPPPSLPEQQPQRVNAASGRASYSDVIGRVAKEMGLE